MGIDFFQGLVDTRNGTIQWAAVGEVGVKSFADLPPTAPPWVRAFTAIGLEMGQQPNRSDGEFSPVAVISVPTGQYAAWIIAAGAFGAPPKLTPIGAIGEYTCTTWVDETQQIGDREVSVTLKDGALIHKVGRTTYTRGLPVVQHHLSLPEVRARHRCLSRNEALRIKQVIQPLMPKTEHWYMWWTRQCLSPVVVVGDGGEYLLSQKNELVKHASEWMWDTSRTLLRLDMRRVREIERLLEFPFSIISPRAASQSAWARSIRPRLVIYTSWSAFSRRRADTFAGCPTVVLVNRRVQSAIRFLEWFHDNHGEMPSAVKPLDGLPKGIAMRMFDVPVTTLVADSELESEDDDGF